MDIYTLKKVLALVVFKLLLRDRSQLVNDESNAFLWNIKDKRGRKRRRRSTGRGILKEDAPHYILELIHSSMELKLVRSLGKETKRFIAQLLWRYNKSESFRSGRVFRVYLDSTRSRIQMANKL